MRNPEIDKFRDIIQSYFDKHQRNFDNFSVCVMWKKNHIQIKRISVPSIITPENSHLFKPSMVDLPQVIIVLPLDFLDSVDKNITEEVDEINIIFLSHLDDISFIHYVIQPKSRIERKLIKN